MTNIMTNLYRALMNQRGSWHPFSNQGVLLLMGCQVQEFDHHPLWVNLPTLAMNQTLVEGFKLINLGGAMNQTLVTNLGAIAIWTELS